MLIIIISKAVATQISNKEPKRAPKAFYSQENFCWTNDIWFPAHSALLKQKREKVWSSAVGKKNISADKR